MKSNSPTKRPRKKKQSLMGITLWRQLHITSMLKLTIEPLGKVAPDSAFLSEDEEALDEEDEAEVHLKLALSLVLT